MESGREILLPVRENAGAAQVRFRNLFLDRPSGGLRALVDFGVVLFCLAPIALAPDLPLVDYPNHLARLYILASYDDVPELQQYYQPNPQPYPNLAIDLVGPPLIKRFGADLGGRLSVLFAAALYCAGCLSLSRTAGASPTAGRLGCLLLYGSPLLWGLLNFLAGLGAFMLTLAVWMRRRSAWSAPGLAGVAALSFACYFMHLTSYGFLAVCICCLSLRDAFSGRSRWSAAAAGIGVVVFPAIFHVFRSLQGGGPPLARISHREVAKSRSFLA